MISPIGGFALTLGHLLAYLFPAQEAPPETTYARRAAMASRPSSVFGTYASPDSE